MSNAKVPAYRRQANSKSNPKPECQKLLILKFEIHLKFACLCEAASAKAGILKFEINVSTRLTQFFFIFNSFHP
jgi:hypothetical protein